MLRRTRFDAREADFYEALYTQSRASFGAYVDAGTLLNNYAHIFDLVSGMQQQQTAAGRRGAAGRRAAGRRAGWQAGMCCQDTCVLAPSLLRRHQSPHAAYVAEFVADAICVAADGVWWLHSYDKLLMACGVAIATLVPHGPCMPPLSPPPHTHSSSACARLSTTLTLWCTPTQPATAQQTQHTTLLLPLLPAAAAAQQQRQQRVTPTFCCLVSTRGQMRSFTRTPWQCGQQAATQQQQ